ncbi:hypothetical protein V8F20_002046 [Naviculisporaceae sp. PSN 640]
MGVCSDEQIIPALAEVKLWEGGLDENLNWQTVSHGQRQLPSIARGLLRDAKIHVLDQVAGSSGKEAEIRINRIIESRLEGLAVISVVHKMSSAVAFQKIVVMKKGQRVELV